MALRCLESIASRCIIVGRCPSEMRELFGYDPVEADPLDPAEQIDDILTNLARYEPLPERNYQRLPAIETWDARISTMLELLCDRGYDSRRSVT